MRKVLYVVIGLVVLGALGSALGGGSEAETACDQASAEDLSAINDSWRQRYDLEAASGWSLARDGHHLVAVQIPGGVAVFANEDVTGDLWIAANETAKTYSRMGELLAVDSPAWTDAGGGDSEGIAAAEACTE